MAAKKFVCIDAHTCGNPVRLVAEGGPLLIGKSMSEKRQHFLEEYDWIRKGLMFEPRGHDMMSGSILYAPHDPENDVAVLIYFDKNFRRTDRYIVGSIFYRKLTNRLSWIIYQNICRW